MGRVTQSSGPERYFFRGLAAKCIAILAFILIASSSPVAGSSLNEAVADARIGKRLLEQGKVVEAIPYFEASIRKGR